VQPSSKARRTEREKPPEMETWNPSFIKNLFFASRSQNAQRGTLY
jgi:hypothetical protein